MDSSQGIALAGNSTCNEEHRREEHLQGKAPAGKSGPQARGLQALKIKEIHPAHRTGW